MSSDHGPKAISLTKFSSWQNSWKEETKKLLPAHSLLQLSHSSTSTGYYVCRFTFEPMNEKGTSV